MSQREGKVHKRGDWDMSYTRNNEELGSVAGAKKPGHGVLRQIPELVENTRG